MALVHSAEPRTPEGELVRAARKRRKLTMREAADLLGIGLETLGYIERGHREQREHKPSDADLARIAAELGIPADELDRIGRRKAADLLRAFVPQAETEALALVDELFAALVANRPDREVLEFLWRALDGDGWLKPLRDRVRDVADWADADGRARRAERSRDAG